MTGQKDQEVRIGVFVCHCGSNIGGVVDCAALAEYASTLPNVAHAEHNLYTCSEVGLSRIKEAVVEHDLNRVVVASCTPRTHEPLFRETINEAGLNPYLFEMVNIRDQCTWVHMKEPDKAFEKAKDLIRMGVGKAAHLEPLEKYRVDVVPAAAVVGGGIAGMTAALSLARQGFEVHVVERQNELGGTLRLLHEVYPGGKAASQILEERLAAIEADSNVHVHLSTTIKEVHGFVGNFTLLLEGPGGESHLTVGAVVLATGGKVLSAGEVAGELPEFAGERVIDQVELERRMKEGSVDAKDVVMIQCAGARNEKRPYCSNTCCLVAVKNALALKRASPDVNVTVLYRDVQLLGTKYETLYRQARKAGVLFVRYAPPNLPETRSDMVVVQNELLGEKVGIRSDLVVLSTPTVAHDDTRDLAQLFKVPVGNGGFLLEAHVKLRPVDFATDGVFVCGTARWPSDVSECVAQGYAAASRASRILSHPTFEVEGAVANIPERDKSLCVGCEVCIKVCPFGAIKKNEQGEVEVISVLCKGCGTCVSTCPHHALTIFHFTNEQILSQIAALAGRSAR
ncbi:MAG: hypothetical protein Kow0069_02600 [Promethearchaeota archaeon]